MADTSEVLTTPEASHLLGVSIRTVHRRVEAGDLAALRKLPGPNGAFLFERSEIERYQARAADGEPSAAAS